MKKFSKIVFVTLLSLTLLAAFALTACGVNSSKVTITLSKTELSLSEGGAKGSIVATVTGSDATGEWSVDNTDVVSIQALGLVCTVTPLKQGTAVVTVKIGDKEASCNVTVAQKEEAEVVTVTLDGNPVTSLSMEMGDVKTLAATASKGSSITWQSDDENVVTVKGGVVTAVRPGTTIVRAAVSNKIKAEVSVTVTKSEGSDYYDLKFSTEGDSETIVDPDEEAVAINSDEFFYWSARATWGQQQVEVSYSYYLNGKVNFAYTCDTDDGHDYGYQLFYKNSAHSVGKFYKLSCKINIDQDCTVNLNGNKVDLKEGDNVITVYYQYTNGLHANSYAGVSSFDLVMGYNGLFVQNAVVTVSDVQWEEDTARVQLVAPSFTLDKDGVISITDTNEVGVGGYLLNVYDGETFETTIDVKNGEKINTATLSKGTYTVKLVSTAISTHYINSEPSETSATISVSKAASYDLAKADEDGAAATPGVWTYHSQDWVTVSEAKVDDGVITISFTNNAGFFYDTQLFYKNPTNVANKTYKVTVTINSTGKGKVTLNGVVVDLKVGTHQYEVTAAEGAVSFSLQVGYDDGTLNQDGVVIGKAAFSSGTIVVSNLSFEEVEPTPIEGAIAAGSEVDSLTNVGKWIYWAAQEGWGANGIVTVSSVSCENGVVDFTYTATEGTYWFGMQLFYKNASNVAGKNYKLVLKINSSVAGDITVNGKVFTLVVGNNDIVIDSYTETEKGASLSIQFGKKDTSTVLGGTFKVSDVSFTEVSGGSTEGGDQGGDQGGSDTPVEGTAFVFGEEDKKVITAPDTWYYWNDQWWCKSNVTVTKAVIVDNVVKFAYTSTGHCTFGAQLFYKNTSLTEGNKYKLTLTIKSSVAGDIRVNGQIVTLVVGDNDVVVEYTETANKASISIQFGNETADTMVQSGEFELSNVVYVDVTGAPSEGGDEGGDEGGSDTPAEGAETVELELQEVYGGNQFFHFTATTSCDLTTADKVFVNGNEASHKEASDNNNGTYTVKIGSFVIEAGEYSFHWEKDGKIIALANYTYTPASSGDQGGSEDTGDAVIVTLKFEEFYGEHYFHFSAESSYDMKNIDYVKVNGTQRACEVTADGGNKYTLKMFVADTVVAGEYTFEWVKDGKVVATASYTYAPEGSGSQGGNESGEQGGSDTPAEGAADVALKFDSAYGDFYLFFWATTTCDISKATQVNVNGVKADWIEITTTGETNKYAFRIKVAQPTVTTTYTFTWLNGDTIIASGTGTYKV